MVKNSWKQSEGDDMGVQRVVRTINPLGSFLADVREIFGLTQERFSQQIQVSQSALSEAERGTRSLSIRAGHKLITRLDLPLGLQVRFLFSFLGLDIHTWGSECFGPDDLSLLLLNVLAFTEERALRPSHLGAILRRYQRRCKEGNFLSRVELHAMMENMLETP